MSLLNEEKITQIENLIRNIQDNENNKNENNNKDIEKNYIASNHTENFLLNIKKLIKYYGFQDMYKTRKSLIYYDKLKDMDSLEIVYFIDSLELYLFFRKLGWIEKTQDLSSFIDIYKSFRNPANINKRRVS